MSNLSPIFFDDIFQMSGIELSKAKIIKTEISILIIGQSSLIYLSAERYSLIIFSQ